MLGHLHLLCATLSLLLGALILLGRKGTALHVRLGWLYLLCMICMNVTALFIRRLTGRLNVFHFIAIISLAMIIAAVVQIAMRERLRRWLWRHYQYMAWSYVSLVAGACNEAFVHLRFMRQLSMHWGKGLPLIASAVIVAASAWVIARRQHSTLAKHAWADGEKPAAG